MNRNTLTFSIILCLHWMIQSQSIDPVIIANAGTHINNQNATLQWTLGESFTDYFETDRVALTVGFHGYGTPSLTSSTASPEFEMVVFPNPVADYLQINMSSPWQEPGVEVFSIDGRLVYSQDGLEGIDASQWEAGMYMVEIEDRSTGMLGTYKVIKL